MIPLRTALPTRTFPAATLGLVAVYAGVFAYAAAMGSPPGAAFAADARGAAALRLPRHAAALFLHDDWPRLIANVWCLWLFGEALEDRVGRGRFLVFYGVCVLTGAAVLLLDDSRVVMAVGPAVPVAGVIGAHFVLYPRSRVLMLLPLPSDRALIEVSSLSIVAFWAAIHLAAALAPPDPALTAMPRAGLVAAAVALTAATGALLVRAFTRPERMQPEWWHDGV